MCVSGQRQKANTEMDTDLPGWRGEVLCFPIAPLPSGRVVKLEFQISFSVWRQVSAVAKGKGADPVLLESLVALISEGSGLPCFHSNL